MGPSVRHALDEQSADATVQQPGKRRDHALDRALFARRAAALTSVAKIAAVSAQRALTAGECGTLRRAERELEHTTVELLMSNAHLIPTGSGGPCDGVHTAAELVRSAARVALLHAIAAYDTQTDGDFEPWARQTVTAAVGRALEHANDPDTDVTDMHVPRPRPPVP